MEDEKTFSDENDVKSFLRLLGQKGYVPRSFTGFAPTPEGAGSINACISCLKPIEENENLAMIYDAISSNFGDFW